MALAKGLALVSAHTPSYGGDLLDFHWYGLVSWVMGAEYFVIAPQSSWPGGRGRGGGASAQFLVTSVGEPTVLTSL